MTHDAAPLPPSVQRAVLDLALKATSPLYWHEADTPWPRPVTGGSCFALRFAEMTIGVTAAHVYRAVRHVQRTRPKVIVQVATSLLTTSELIDIDDDLDLATFRWQRVGGQPIDCRDQWPPPPLENMRGLVLVGFPESLREVRGDQSATFGAWGSLSAVESLTATKIMVTYDPTRDLEVAGFGVPKPPLHGNMSGCSGGLAMMVGMQGGLLRWYPVGAIIHGPKGEGTDGLLADIDLITLARLDCIQPDGRIARRGQS